MARKIGILEYFKIFMLLLFIGLICGTGYVSGTASTNYFVQPNTDSYVESTISLDQDEIQIPYVSASNVIIDGIISENEYLMEINQSMIGGAPSHITIYWEYNDENLTVALVSPGAGWVALGIGTDMTGANMILGGYNGTNSYCYDLIGTSFTTHDEDVNQGGSNDILDFAATEDTQTILEFIIPLDSGDTNDTLLEEDTTYSMFFSYHATQDNQNIASSYHGFNGYTDYISVILTESPPGEDLDIEFDKSIPLVTESHTVIDGQIEENEYPEFTYDAISQMTIYWEHSDENLTIGLVSQSTGWLAIGIGEVMLDSNMIMGGVRDGVPYCVDLVGLSNWLHVEDSSLEDGENNILAYDATEDSSSTTLEFTIPFNSSDPYDPIIEEGKVYSMFLGYHEDSDDITIIHTGHSNIFTVFIRPLAEKVETFLTVDIPTTVEHNENFTINIQLKDENNSLGNVPVEFFMKTQFGDLMISKALTDANGTATFNYMNPDLSLDHVFGIRSQEKISIKDGKVFAYSGNEVTQTISFLPGEEEEEEPFVELSRYGIITAFWVVGFIIWASFSVSVWGVIEIFSDRNSLHEEKQDKNEGEDQI
ncbi:MAG: DOMON domain-containing protein [Candidatus Kariarchaeaceae archaeon]|jgi:hypothetical protein